MYEKQQQTAQQQHHCHHHHLLHHHHCSNELNNGSFSKVNHFKGSNLPANTNNNKQKHSSVAFDCSKSTSGGFGVVVDNNTENKTINTGNTENIPKLSNVMNKGILKLDTKHHDELKSNIRKHQSYQSWVSENIKAKNIDLPGRVSFSTNNVYEIEYSDYEDTSDNKSLDSPKPTKSVPKPLNNETFKPLQAQDLLLDSIQHTEDTSDDTQTSETDETMNDHHVCPSRCSNMYDPSVAKARMESKARQEADKIVEEYRREIEELKKIHLKNPYSSPIVALAASSKPCEENHRKIFDDNESPLRLSERTSKSFDNLFQKLSTIDDNKDSKEKATISSSSTSSTLVLHETTKPNEMLLPMKLNNIWEKENKLNVHASTNAVNAVINPNKFNVQPASCSSTASSTIKNYLNKSSTNKTHENTRKQKTKKSTTSKTNKDATKHLKTTNRVKSAPTTSNASKMRKSKSIPSLREDRNIDEFEIDKVVSWMSIHDDFSDTASVNNAGGASKIMKNDTTTMLWKVPSCTTTSTGNGGISGTAGTNTTKNVSSAVKTMKKRCDDEGNFSIEEGHDTDSPYEEIVSVIKEIEDGKLSKGKLLNKKFVWQLELI